MKAVFVGATRGMGKALARRLAERADALYLAGRDAEGLALTARDLEARGARAPVRSGPLDLGDPGGFAAALDAADAALDRFDTLVITAGLFGAQDALAKDAARLERLLSGNFTGTALLCQLAAERLAERGGVSSAPSARWPAIARDPPTISTAPPRRGSPPSSMGSGWPTPTATFESSACGRASCAPR
jgi:NAD(P)-dependent dehydrogenase (short-subunit alcohol dehydrogenase family)